MFSLFNILVDYCRISLILFEFDFFLSINNDEIVCNKTFVRVQQILKKNHTLRRKIEYILMQYIIDSFFFHCYVLYTILTFDCEKYHNKRFFFLFFFRCYFLGYFWMSFVVVRLECIYYMNESNQIKSNQIQSHESTTQKLNDDAWFFLRENDFVCFFCTRISNLILSWNRINQIILVDVVTVND